MTNANRLLESAISDVERWWDHLFDHPAVGPKAPRPSTESAVAPGGTFLQFPPGGGAAQAAPNAFYSYLVGRRMGNNRLGRLANITIVCTSGSVTFQYIDANDTPSSIQTITAGNGYHDTNHVIQAITVTGTGKFALQLNAPPADIDVPALLFLSSPTVTAIVPQLPPTLTIGGNLRVAVEEPITGAGSVQVHDTGA